MEESNINGKKILLVGGAGFIGHNLALSLKKQGADVQIVDSLGVNNLLYLNDTTMDIPNRELYLKVVHERFRLLQEARVPLHVQDCRDYFKLCQIFDNFKPQVVVVLAAVAHANRSNKDPYTTFDHSLRTLENALDASKNHVKHFVYFSSSMVYGNFEGGEVNEETICNPLGIYGALKFAGEKMVIAYNQVFDLPYTIVRPSALYGERCISGRVSQIFIENAILGKEIMINGDGSDRLDFTYIGDLVSGVTGAIANESAHNEIFNITYGSSRSLKDLLDIVQEEFEGAQVTYKPKDKLMPDRGTLSVNKAKEVFGYNPSYPIDKGVREYIKWYRELLDS